MPGLFIRIKRIQREKVRAKFIEIICKYYNNKKIINTKHTKFAKLAIFI